MRVLEYVGDMVDLKYRTVLVSKEDAGWVSVQFDFAEGVPMELQDMRCFGWWWMNAADFRESSDGR
jgi:hypothetical protein